MLKLKFVTIPGHTGGLILLPSMTFMTAHLRPDFLFISSTFARVMIEAYYTSYIIFLCRSWPVPSTITERLNKKLHYLNMVSRTFKKDSSSVKKTFKSAMFFGRSLIIRCATSYPPQCISRHEENKGHDEINEREILVVPTKGAEE